MDVTLGSGHQVFAFTRDGATQTITDFRSIYFTMDFSGSQEVPPNLSTATGSGTGVLNFRQTEFSFAFDTDGVDFDGLQTPGDATDNVVAMHIHNAPEGVSGGVIFGFDGDANTVIDPEQGTVSGLWTAANGFDALDTTKILDELTYVNVHTARFPAGEIRAQILLADDGRDRIDLTALNIGSLDTLREITENANGAATITVYTDGVATRLRLPGLSENNLKASHFIFGGSTPVIDSGTAGRDDLFGPGGNDTLKGLGGNDRLFGDAGDDALQGGGGKDWLLGGSGLDQLSGGAAGDRFVFRAVSDSGNTRQTADRILDFQDGADRIDLSAIDASAASNGNQSFTLIGSNPFSGEGELRVEQINGDTYISLNTAGIGGSEMMIRIAGLVSTLR